MTRLRSLALVTESWSRMAALSNTAITLPYYSYAKSPFGFPMSPAKWTVTTTDTSARFQTNPVNGTWYNLGSLGITIPIGVWHVSYNALLYYTMAAAGTMGVFGTLSTANNSASNALTTRGVFNRDLMENENVCSLSGLLYTLTAKTQYYFNAAALRAGCTLIFLDNPTLTLSIKAVCAYL